MATKLDRGSDRGPDRGSVRLDSNECKGCGLCVEACPPRVLRLSSRLNPYGYHAASYLGSKCTGCGICFFVCPEPGAITVLRGSHVHANVHSAPIN